MRSVLGVLCAVALFTPGVAAGAKEPDRPARIVIFSLPHVVWADIEAADAPNLDRFVRSAAVANLSVRTAATRTTLARGYATVGAGNRAAVGAFGEQAFDANENIDNSSAQETYKRRTGFDRAGAIYQVGIAGVIRANETRLYGAVPGALGSALRDAGRQAAVLGNADGPTLTGASRLDAATELEVVSDTEVKFDPSDLLGRSVALAAMDRDGVVSAGAVGEILLRSDQASPYGVRLDTERVLRRIDTLLADTDVLVIEASDLARVERAAPLATPEQNQKLARRALRDADDLFGEVLERAPLSETLYIVMAPAATAEREELTVFAMAGPGVEPGYAVSPSTRRAGYVTLLDIAPTVLAALGIDRPAEMTGRPVRVEPGDTNIAGLVAANDRAVARDGLFAAAVVVYILLQALTYVAAGLLLRSQRVSRPFAFAGSWLLLMPAAMFLVRVLPFQDWSVPLTITAVGVVAGVLAALVSPLGRWWPLAPPWAACAFTCVLLGADVVSGGRLQIDSILGYSPIVAGRFAGFGNLAFAVFFATAILAATFPVMRFGPTRAAQVGVAVFFAAVVVVSGAPAWGSDIGGVLAGLPALAITWTLLTGQKVRLRALVLTIAGVVAVLAVFALLDFARPAQSRTHLGRLIESVADGGFGALAMVLRRKAEANLSILTSSVFVWLVPVTVAYIVVITLQTGGLRAALARFPALRAGLVGVVVLGVAGMLLNDSGIAISAMILGVVAPVLLCLRAADAGGLADCSAEQPAAAPSTTEPVPVLAHDG
jgi:hypothetical protein